MITNTKLYFSMRIKKPLITIIIATNRKIIRSIKLIKRTKSEERQLKNYKKNL